MNPDQHSASSSGNNGNIQTQIIGGLQFVACSLPQAAQLIIGAAISGQGSSIHLANAYTVALADKILSYRKVLAHSRFIFPDGRPLSWVSVVRRQKPVLHQVRGPSLFREVFDKGRSERISHYLLGSTPEVLTDLACNLRSSYSGIQIAGSESPPFREMTKVEINQQDDRIRNSGAQIVWIGLGTPKQDYEAARLAKSVPVTAVAIGAAFDFVAGATKEAPTWMSRFGVEWIYRFAQEPRRLWKRYLFGNARFLWAALAKSSLPKAKRSEL